jgi:hypothetical protein
MTIRNVEHGPEGLTAEQLAHLGEGAIAYVRPITSEDAQNLFPQISGLEPGQQLFALLGANGAPILLAEGMQVLGADLADGLLSVDLVRPEPERIVKTIEITLRS